VVTASFDGRAKVWDVTTGRETVTMPGVSSLYGAAFSPDGKRVVTAGNDKTAKIWDLKGNLLVTLRGHQGFLHTAVFSPDGNRVATGGADGKAKIWNARTGAEEMTFDGQSGQVTGLAFRPDGKQLVTASGVVLVYALDISDLLDLARGRITRVPATFTSEECEHYFASQPCPTH
jgi:WD40 repeat protein